MANRLSQDKARAIAVEYCSNGRKKKEAMLTVGYSMAYASTGEGLKTYDNLLVKAEIRAIDEQIAEKAVFTRKQSLAELEEARAIAKVKKDASSMVSATRGKNKLYGLEIDTRLDVKLDAGQRPPDAAEARKRSNERIAAFEET